MTNTIIAPNELLDKVENIEGSLSDASESTKGIAQLATEEEALAGENNTKIMTPAKVKAAIDAGGGSTYTAGNNIQISDENVISATSSYITNTNAIVGTGAPTSSIEAQLGQIYVDSSTGDAYVCNNVVTTPHYNIVGNPTITDGIASNFSNSDYLTISSSTTGLRPVSGTDVYYKFRNLANQSHKTMALLYGCDMIAFTLSSLSNYSFYAWNYTSNTEYSLGSKSFTVNSWVYVKVSYSSNGKKSYYLSSDGITYTLLNTFTDSTREYRTDTYLGYNPYAPAAYMDQGEIDLKFIKLVETSTGNVLWKALTYTTSWTKIASKNYDPDEEVITL